MQGRSFYFDYRFFGHQKQFLILKWRYFQDKKTIFAENRLHTGITCQTSLPVLLLICTIKDETNFISTMTAKLKSHIILSVLAILSLVALSSCEDYYYHDPLTGSWIYSYDEYGYVDSRYADVYYFGADGYGYLDWYDEWGYNHVDDFSWSSHGDYLDIYYFNGSSEYYCFYFRNGDLVLWDGYDPYHYWGFRRY